MKSSRFLGFVLAATLLAFGTMSSVAIAAPATAVVYDALPNPLPANAPSEAFQATQTAELGDHVHLGGTSRILDTVTVAMSDWAVYSTYASDPRYMGNSTTWSHPITLNVYSTHLGANGAPDTLLATKTQTIDIPWRPAEDSTNCPTKDSPGYAYKWQSVPGDPDTNCNNGFAFDAVFDLSSLNAYLPSEVIVSVAFDTETYGTSPLGTDGPYDSLNVLVPPSQAVTVGSDDSNDKVFQNSSTAGNYADGGAAGVGILREDTNWSPYGTIAMQITAAATPSTVYVDSTWSAVPAGQDPDGTGPATRMGFDAFATIQAGVNAVASDGTVNVASGIYTEQLNITKGVHVIGAGNLMTTVKAPGSLVDNGFGTDIVTVNGSGISVELAQLQVTGPGPIACGGIYAGIVVVGGATADIHDDIVSNITDSSVSGCQNGYAIRIGRSSLGTTGTATVTNNSVTGYQKGGIAVDNAGSSATITGNTVTGIGDTVLIAQNGILVVSGATATITNNTVSGNEYSGPSGGADFLNNTQSVGILLNNAGDGVTVSGNAVSGNDIGIYNLLSGSGTTAISTNTLTANRYEGIALDQGAATLTGNTVSGGNVGIAVVNYDGNTGNTTGTITGNSVSGIVADVEFVDQNGSDAFTVAGVLHNNSFGGTATNVENESAASVDATENYWGSDAGPIGNDVSGTGAASVLTSPWYTDAGRTTLKGVTTTSGGEASTTVPSAVNQSGTSTDGSSVAVAVAIPAGTTITGTDSWDGTLKAPTATTATVTVPGYDTTITSAIAIGSDDTDLAFDKAVRLSFAGQAGKLVGWYDHAGVFTEITTLCSADDQATMDSEVAAGGSCKKDVAGDLVVWTKHFSTFTTYSLALSAPNISPNGQVFAGSVVVSFDDQPGTTVRYTADGSTPTCGSGSGYSAPFALTTLTTIKAVRCDATDTSAVATATFTPASGGGGGGGGGGGSAAATPTTSTPAVPTTAPAPTTGTVTGTTGGEVLGAATYNFAANLTVGSTGADVTALQQVLIDAGFLKIPAPTGYFGALTRAAVKLYQTAHAITPASGYVGVLTRAQLNAGTVPTGDASANPTSLEAQIKAALDQVAALQAKLKAMGY